MTCRSLAAAVVVVTLAVSPAVPGGATPAGGKGRIAFERARLHENRSEIFVADADGAGARRVSHAPPETFDSEPDWSRDGTTIAFERCPAAGSACSVWIVRADGRGEQLGTPEGVDATAPAFAPDGRHVVYVRSSGAVKANPSVSDENQIERSEIVLADLYGGDERVLVALGGYRGDLGGPQFSPDGRSIVFARQNSWLSRPVGGSTLFVADADGRNVRPLTPWALAAGGHADWSPDGRRILLRTFGGDGGRIYTIGADGRGLRLVTRGLPPATGEPGLSLGSFSPDGRWIVFGTTFRATNAIRGIADIEAVRADGTGLRNVTRSPN